MGKKDKHKLGQSRNNAVFKVVNGKANKQKGKAQEVKTKLKKVNYIIILGIKTCAHHSRTVQIVIKRVVLGELRKKI